MQPGAWHGSEHVEGQQALGPQVASRPARYAKLLSMSQPLNLHKTHCQDPVTRQEWLNLSCGLYFPLLCHTLPGVTELLW